MSQASTPENLEDDELAKRNCWGSVGILPVYQHKFGRLLSGCVVVPIKGDRYEAYVKLWCDDTVPLGITPTLPEAKKLIVTWLSKTSRYQLLLVERERQRDEEEKKQKQAAKRAPNTTRGVD